MTERIPGWTLSCTGGGCTALEPEQGDGRWLITNDDSSAPELGEEAYLYALEEESSEIAVSYDLGKWSAEAARYATECMREREAFETIGGFDCEGQ